MNADLATVARDLAAAAEPGSMPRRAYVPAALAALGELTGEAA